MSTQFSATSTAEDVVKAFGAGVKGKVAIVTGSNTGIGFETVRALASVGVKVFAAARSQANSEATVKKIKDLVPEGDVHPLELELGQLASVRKAAETFLALDLPLHILINNAGVMAPALTFSKDNIELQFGVNHIGHFLFTTLLFEKLKSSAPARVVNVSSVGHFLFGQRGILFDDLGLDGKVNHYNRWERYANSKLANILFTKELQRRFDETGAEVICTSLHPVRKEYLYTFIYLFFFSSYFFKGAIGGTDLSRHDGMYGWDFFQYFFRVVAAIFREPNFRNKTIPQGAATSVFVAIAPNVVKGEYYSDVNIATVNRNPLINDVEMAKKLWAVSEETVARK